MSRRTNRSRPLGSIRIIGGQLRGRRLAVPAAGPLRPTPNRVRETLFNWLAPQIEGARCLDLFAGSGALGIESLSRGAAEVRFVESDARIARQLEAEIARLGLTATVLCEPAVEALHGPAEPRYDIVFVDPPYDARVDALLGAVEPWLTARGCVYLERRKRDGLPELGWGEWIKRGQAASVCFGLAARS